MHSEFPIPEFVEPDATAPAPVDEWARIFDGLRQRFPDASDGVLFCIHKLQQNPELKLRDFKEEAALHRVPLSGRSYHSARVQLGLEKPTPPRAREVEASEPANSNLVRALAADTSDAEDNPLISALRRFQAESTAEIERLRAGIRAVVAIVDAALAED